MATKRTFSIEIFFAVSNFLKLLKVIVKVSRISCVEGPLATPLDDRILLRLNSEITQNFTNGKIYTGLHGLPGNKMGYSAAFKWIMRS